MVRRFLKSLPWLLMIALISGVAGIISAHSLVLGLSLCAGGFVVSVGVAKLGGHNGLPRYQNYRWIPYGWLLLLLISDHNLTTGRTPLDAAAGVASLQNIVESGIYLSVGLGVAATWKLFEIPRDFKVRWGLWPRLPAFYVISTAWSVIPLFSLARSLQFAAPVALGLLHARIWLASAELGRLIWARSLRLAVQVISLLTMLGFLIGDPTDPGATAYGDDGRFSWPGIHPVHGAIIMGAAFLILIVGGRALTSFSAPVYWGQVALYCGALFLSQTRSALGALVFALLVALWLGGRKEILTRYLGIFYFLCCAALIWVAAQQEIVDYLARGQSVDRLSNLNGRIPLWTIAIQETSQSGRWFQGFGYGSPRVILFGSVDWAGTAHNAWIEILLGVGFLGMTLAALAVLQLGYQLVRRGAHARLRSSILAGTLFMFVVAVSASTPGFSLPSFDFTMLSILFVYAIAHKHSRNSRSTAGMGPDERAYAA